MILLPWGPPALIVASSGSPDCHPSLKLGGRQAFPKHPHAKVTHSHAHGSFAVCQDPVRFPVYFPSFGKPLFDSSPALLSACELNYDHAGWGYRCGR